MIKPIQFSNFITQNTNDLIAYKASHPFDKLTIITDQSSNKNYFIATEVGKILNYGSGEKITRLIFNKSEYHRLPVQFLNQIKNLELYIDILPSGYLIINETGFLNTLLKTTKLNKCLKHSLIKELEDLKIINGVNSNLIPNDRKEIEFFNLLKDVLIPFNIEIETQVFVDQYRVDFYIPKLNIVIEYDENGHKHYDHNLEKEREEFIKYKLGCNIIRVSDNYNHGINCGKVIKQLIEFL